VTQCCTFGRELVVSNPGLGGHLHCVPRRAEGRGSQHFGRPGTPTDQAWIETLFGHIKAEWPHLLAIRDPAVLRAELAVVRAEYNSVRLHEGIGYVPPNDEHEGRGPAIRKARQAGTSKLHAVVLIWPLDARQRRSTSSGRAEHLLANGLVPVVVASPPQSCPFRQLCVRRRSRWNTPIRS